MKNIIYDEFEYIIGENAKDNWDILNKSNQNDIWFHLNKLVSPYVILKINNKIKKLEKKYIIYGANLCKNNSKYNNFKNLKIIYTEIKNVKKTNKIGEVISKNVNYISI